MLRLATILAILLFGTATLALVAELASSSQDDALSGRAADAYAGSLAETSDALYQDVAGTAASLSASVDEPEARLEGLSRRGIDARLAYDLAVQTETRLPQEHPARERLVEANRSTSKAAYSLHRFAESRNERLLDHARTTLTRAERELGRARAEVA